MHGEYKTPGGKLVIADFDVQNGCLAGVEVSGDFFLEPPKALEGIIGALEDAPRTSRRRSSRTASAPPSAPRSRWWASPPKRSPAP